METPRPITGMPKGLEENSRSNRKKQEIIESTTPAVYESQDKTGMCLYLNINRKIDLEVHTNNYRQRQK